MLLVYILLLLLALLLLPAWKVDDGGGDKCGEVARGDDAGGEREDTNASKSSSGMPPDGRCGGRSGDLVGERARLPRPGIDDSDGIYAEGEKPGCGNGSALSSAVPRSPEADGDSRPDSPTREWPAGAPNQRVTLSFQLLERLRRALVPPAEVGGEGPCSADASGWLYHAEADVKSDSDHARLSSISSTLSMEFVGLMPL